jgi:uncharacterized protein (TIGR02452 family)
MTREELVEVYKHTKEVCSEFEIPKSEKLSDYPPLFRFESFKGEIIVEPLDTVSALAKYINDGKTAVLNMASNIRKGGGVEKGAMAQEECLFRCSNLFTIPDEFYPLAVDEFIYTHQATFVKSADYGTIWPMDADVITMAALNMNVENKYYNADDSKDGYEKIMTNKIETMLIAAAAGGCKNIILGAWGCGVFKNDPATVAKLFSVALTTKRCLFEKIVFAVINDANSVGNNYQIFYDTFNGVQA